MDTTLDDSSLVEVNVLIPSCTSSFGQVLNLMFVYAWSLPFASFMVNH